MSMPKFDFISHPLGTLLKVKISPGSSRDEIRGEHDGGLKLSIKAPPERGKANKELIKLLAKMTGIDRKSISIVSGETSRAKKILFEGVAAPEMQRILNRIVGK